MGQTTVDSSQSAKDKGVTPKDASPRKLKWVELYRRIPLEVALADLKPTGPEGQADKCYYRVECPVCGKRSAFVYTSSLTIVCNRQNTCETRMPVGDYLWEHVMKARGWSKKQMADWIEKLAEGREAPATGAAPAEGQREGIVPDSAVYEALMDLCPLTDEAYTWLERERGIRGEAALKAGMGFVSNPRQVAEALVKRFGRQRLLSCGLLREFETEEGGTKDLFKFSSHRLLFAYRVAGRVVYLTGRLTRPAKEEQSKELHSGGSLSAPWGIDVITSGHVYLTEGGIDALTLIDMGLSAVSIPGAGTWQAAFTHLLTLKGVNEVTLALDPDGAGRKQLPRIARQLMAMGITVHQLALPLVQKNGEVKKCDVNDWFGKKAAFAKTLEGAPAERRERLFVGIGEAAAARLKAIGKKTVLFENFDDAGKGLLNLGDPPLRVVLIVGDDFKKQGGTESLVRELLKKRIMVSALLKPGDRKMGSWIEEIVGATRESRPKGQPPEIPGETKETDHATT